MSGAPSSSVASTPSTGAHVLTSAQAQQLIQRLNAQHGHKVGQTIKIQTVQTNPQTGVRQIIAIPIQTTSAAGLAAVAGGGAAGIAGSPKISVSPMKLKASLGASPPVVSATTASLGQNVKVVKLSAAQEHVATTLQQV